MKPRDFLGHAEELTIKATPYCLPCQFLPPPTEVQDRIPASAIGTYFKRFYPIDLPQIGWRITHRGHWWRVIEIEQFTATKGSRDQDYLPLRICKYLEPIA